MTTTAEARLSLDMIHNALGVIATANVSPYLSAERRREIIQEAADQAAAALRVVERHNQT